MHFHRGRFPQNFHIFALEMIHPKRVPFNDPCNKLFHPLSKMPKRHHGKDECFILFILWGESHYSKWHIESYGKEITVNYWECCKPIPPQKKPMDPQTFQGGASYMQEAISVEGEIFWGLEFLSAGCFFWFHPRSLPIYKAIYAKLLCFTNLDFPEIREFPLLNHHFG